MSLIMPQNQEQMKIMSSQPKKRTWKNDRREKSGLNSQTQGDQKSIAVLYKGWS